MTAPRPAVPNGVEKQVIVTACEAFIRDVLKPRFLPQIRPIEWNYVVDINGAWAAGRYRFIQRYRSGMEHNRGEEFDTPFARIDRMGRDSFDIYWMRHTGKWCAASHRRDACRGASNPRNGRHPASRLTPNARPRRENPVGDDRFRKTEILAHDGDTHVAPELRARVRDRMAVEADAPPVVARTVGELCARAHAVGLAREQAAAEKLAAERKRQVEEAEKAGRVRLDTIAQRGESVWRDIEAEIERRNATGYDRAASLPRSPGSCRRTRHDA
ncbi:MAG TPA: hypothetical protein VEN78_26530 [Bradyrhizobium sp.]|nr:hypothetical protein [Bradyrhizobium sp.]